MNPLTIAIDARLVGGMNTGDSSYWNGLIHGLCQLDGDFRLLLFCIGHPTTLFRDRRVNWIRVPAPSARYWSLVSFPLAARHAGAQVIHTQYALSPLVGPHGVTTVHDVSFFVGPEWFRLKDRLLLRLLVPAAVRRARRVLTVSETAKREIERFIPSARGKVRVTPNALSPSYQPICREDAQDVVVRELGVTLPYVLTVGTRWPRKNTALATNSMRLLAADLPHKLVVSGRPGWGDEQTDSRTLTVGYVAEEHLWALYSAADLYLAPSRHEGFGIPLLEAWACRCPVVCSTGGALPEVAGDAAYVEPSWAPEQWAKAIDALLRSSDRREDLCARGTERLKCFDWRKTAELTMEAYRETAQ